MIGGWNIFYVSLGPRILILKSIGGQIIVNSCWLLKDEGAIDWREGFRNFHWTRETSSRKGHGGLPKERGVSCVGRRGKEENECVRKILVLMCARNKHGRNSMTKLLKFYFK